MKKFTFKKDIVDTWSCTEATIIKYNKREIGYIESYYSEVNKKYYIMLQVYASERALEKNPNCPWMWGTIKTRFNSEPEARLWLNENIDHILPMLYKES